MYQVRMPGEYRSAGRPMKRTPIAERLDALGAHTMRVKEWKGDVVFLHEVTTGAADRSYGIQVARLAGLPNTVIDRAKTILERLEADDSSHNLLRKRMKKTRSGESPAAEDDQLGLF